MHYHVFTESNKIAGICQITLFSVQPILTAGFLEAMPDFNHALKHAFQKTWKTKNCLLFYYNKCFPATVLINTTNQIFRGSNIFTQKWLYTYYVCMYVCMYMYVTKYLYFQIKAVLLNFLFIRVLKYFTNILNSTTGFNIDTNNNVYTTVNQHIRVISEGLCETEDE